MIRLTLAALLLATPASATLLPDVPATPTHSRILVGPGTSGEGTSVDSYGPARAPIRIVTEELLETGRTIGDFRYTHGILASARLLHIAYKGAPEANMPAVPPHTHLTLDPTDRILMDDHYDFTTHPAHCTGTDCAANQPAARLAGENYRRLILTPSPTPEDEGQWHCTTDFALKCTRFAHDAAP